MRYKKHQEKCLIMFSFTKLIYLSLLERLKQPWLDILQFFVAWSPGKMKQAESMKVTRWKWKCSRSVVSNSLWSYRLYVAARILSPWDFPGKNTGVGCHFLLQGIFWTQRLNSGLPHFGQALYHLTWQMVFTFGILSFELLIGGDLLSLCS